MSRIGKKPIIIPEGVTANIQAAHIDVKGPRGELRVDFRPEIKVTLDAGQIIVNPKANSRIHRALFGLTRTLINNAVLGVTEGFTKQLEMKGVGYKAAVEGETLVLHLGFSHPVNFAIPTGINIEVKKNIMTLSGFDKQLVGETAARVRRLRPPEPYKGKGIKYSDEIIRRKAGKTAKAAGAS